MVCISLCIHFSFISCPVISLKLEYDFHGMCWIKKVIQCHVSGSLNHNQKFIPLYFPYLINVITFLLFLFKSSKLWMLLSPRLEARHVNCLSLGVVEYVNKILPFCRWRYWFRLPRKMITALKPLKFSFLGKPNVNELFLLACRHIILKVELAVIAMYCFFSSFTPTSLELVSYSLKLLCSFKNPQCCIWKKQKKIKKKPRHTSWPK